MQTQTNKLFYTLLWIAGAVLILFCVVGVAIGWLPTSVVSRSNDIKFALAPIHSANYHTYHLTGFSAYEPNYALHI